ncbi:MAG: 23S rRNA (adenine(2503)-C(2))-methyltransferase RlmN [Clostridia bacterium]|nr:23S rRNA (adenine(2503)-C(2))-methyltransferase RlmN [Clostridia bacterium]
MIELLSLRKTELEELLLSWGEKRFRADQVYDWLYKGAACSEMHNLPGSLRERLEEECISQNARILETYTSKLDETRKFLFALTDDQVVEGVLMRYHYGNTLCISTQVGCRMGCAFCASTLEGLSRNLTAAEMLSMVLIVNRAYAGEQGRGVTNIVLMGSGEPFDNYEEVVRFLRRVSDPEGIQISLRNISLSTCGLVPGILRFAKEGLPVTLCLSLHAPNDTIRQKTMPVSRVYSMEETLRACRTYAETTGRRLIFEYALVSGVNDAPEHAHELARKLKGINGHVNLIPLNPVRERALNAPDRKQVQQFLEILTKDGISATVRRQMGNDIQGACGQLRRRYLEEAE